jgi:hypothetical protein
MQVWLICLAHILASFKAKAANGWREWEREWSDDKLEEVMKSCEDWWWDLVEGVAGHDVERRSDQTHRNRVSLRAVSVRESKQNGERGGAGMV